MTAGLMALLLLLPCQDEKPDEEKKEDKQEEKQPEAPDTSLVSSILVTVSGSIKLDYLYRNGVLNEVSQWVPGGLVSGSPFNDGGNQVLSKIVLELGLQFDSRWSANVSLSNDRIRFDTFAVASQSQGLGENPESTNVFVERAWIHGSGVFWDWLDIRVGAQDYRIDPAGAASIFLDLGRAESPWGELPDSTAPPFPAAGTNTVPQTRRDEMQPTGIVLDATFGDIDAHLFLFPSVAEGGHPSADESLYGIHVGFPVADDAVRIELILAYLIGATDLGSGTQQQQVLTAGVGGLWAPEELPLEVGLEIYGQFGDAGLMGSQSLDAGGTAARLRVRYVFDDLWVEAGYVFLSGDDDGLDDEEGRFLSYENNDEFLIAESNEFGLDLDNNVQSWRIAGGGTLWDVIDLTLRVGAFTLVEPVPASPDPLPGTVRREDSLGLEFDAVFRIPLGDQVHADLFVAGLWGADVLESFTLRGDDHALLYGAGIHLRF